MAKASEVTLNISAESVPLLPDVLELIEQGMLTRGDKNNRTYVGETVNLGPGVSSVMRSALFDPQTAGGLLISVAADSANAIISEVPGSRIIGTVSGRGNYLIEVN